MDSVVPADLTAPTRLSAIRPGQAGVIVGVSA